MNRADTKAILSWGVYYGKQTICFHCFVESVYQLLPDLEALCPYRGIIRRDFLPFLVMELIYVCTNRCFPSTSYVAKFKSWKCRCFETGCSTEYCPSHSAKCFMDCTVNEGRKLVIYSDVQIVFLLIQRDIYWHQAIWFPSESPWKNMGVWKNGYMSHITAVVDLLGNWPALKYEKSWSENRGQKHMEEW